MNKELIGRGEWRVWRWRRIQRSTRRAESGPGDYPPRARGFSCKALATSAVTGPEHEFRKEPATGPRGKLVKSFCETGARKKRRREIGGVLAFPARFLPEIPAGTGSNFARIRRTAPRVRFRARRGRRYCWHKELRRCARPAFYVRCGGSGISKLRVTPSTRGSAASALRRRSGDHLRSKPNLSSIRS